MKFTYNWLKEYVDVDIPADELSEMLTMAGLEIETLTYLGAGLDNICSVKILDIEKHPNADKLSICKVTDGESEHEIVCGAKNMKGGDIVALAKKGANLPNGIKIKPTKIRGVVSNGMLCSETELGLADEAGGIMILAQDTTIGKPVIDILGLDDYLFEIGLTPNRSDCLSLIGIAREVAMLTGAKLKTIDFVADESSESVSGAIDISIQNASACNRYTARVLRGVSIKESDPIIKSRLNAIGVRSINNIVDITNYVMFVYGQPMHAFDYDKIMGKKIIVRNASDGGKFTTLDEKERELTAGDIMICDEKRAVALGGVMGGMNSEVSDDTKDILLESAYFDPVTIRRTAKRLGLASESSHRFERGVNPQTVTVALDYAASLMQKSTGCKILSGIADVWPVKYESRDIKARFARINKVLGTDLTNDDILNLLGRLMFEVKQKSDEHVLVEIPQYRHDLVKEIDIIEEIARTYGYNNIKVTMPKIPAVSEKRSEKEVTAAKVRSLLVNNGFYEVINYSFCAHKDLEIFSGDLIDRRIGVLNPINEEQSVMRMSLLPALIETVKKNMNHKNNDLKLFEIGRSFMKGDSGEIFETNRFTGIITGLCYEDNWSNAKKVVDFFDIKGIVELILESIKVIRYSFKGGASSKYLHPAVSTQIYIAGEKVGEIGELHPDILEGYGIDKKVYAFDFDFDRLCASQKERVVFRQLPKYPYVKRDIAIVVDKGIACD